VQIQKFVDRFARGRLLARIPKRGIRDRKFPTGPNARHLRIGTIPPNEAAPACRVLLNFLKRVGFGAVEIGFARYDLEQAQRAAQPILKVESLWKTYGAVTAVDDVSFSIAPQEILGQLGPDGAGMQAVVSASLVANDQNVSVVRAPICQQRAAPARRWRRLEHSDSSGDRPMR
jgi:ABC-type glutathione transport system ATPase component